MGREWESVASDKGLCQGGVKLIMWYKSTLPLLLLLFISSPTRESVAAKLVVHVRETVQIQLIGFKGLASVPIFKGILPAGQTGEINTEYHGLALLRHPTGHLYPILIGNEPFTLEIGAPAEPPSFMDSDENDYFYSLLAGKETDTDRNSFALLMIRAKQLLESSNSIQTIKDLNDKKEEFHIFVRNHYHSIKYSDMLRQLLGQYFMMHEYVNYHLKGEPVTNIKEKYRQAVLTGVGNWLEILKNNIPEHEVLNYCVSLYYERSMVTLAALIMDRFRSAAFCPGVEEIDLSFPDDLTDMVTNGNGERRLGEFSGERIISFVSDDCPVSLVDTICRARNLADKKIDIPIIVVPLQRLSGSHLGMNRMLSSGNLYFINDENWRKKTLTKKIKLPLLLNFTKSQQ